MHGQVIYRDSDFVMRFRKEIDGSIIVTVHKTIGVKEYLPNGYLLGSNIMIYKVEAS